VPFAVTVKTADAVVEVALKKFEIDVDVPGEAFSTTPPAGVEVLDSWPEAGPPDDHDAGD
jgi:outer membrane lipoprotein-sorting protein